MVCCQSHYHLLVSAGEAATVKHQSIKQDLVIWQLYWATLNLCLAWCPVSNNKWSAEIRDVVLSAVSEFVSGLETFWAECSFCVFKTSQRFLFSELSTSPLNSWELLAVRASFGQELTSCRLHWEELSSFSRFGSCCFIWSLYSA